MKFQPLKGTRDFLPEEARIRQEVLATVKNVFETFGFQPLETPSLESWEVLAAKKGGGPEVLKETYSFKDKSGRMVGLIYDLTVPLARVVASNPDLPLPFKRYQIQKVWRYGDVAKGRLREFLQCDIDTVGSESMLADAEVIACAVTVLEKLGFKDFFVRINNRKLLSALLKQAGIEKKVEDVLRAIDKLDKIGVDGVKEELKRLKVPESSIKKLLELISIKGDASILEEVKKVLGKCEGISELEELLSFLALMGVSERIRVDLSLARGLDYYTGPIFEISVEEGVGSIAGGGRYDKLIGILSGRDIPATGISLGIERILEVMKSRKMVEERRSSVKAFVAYPNQSILNEVLKLVKELRSSNIKTDFDLRGRKLTRQLEYADALKIPYVIILGETELKKGVVRVRDMQKREEFEVKREEVAKFLSERRP
jgi:histidyl-tRNA synthetase